MNEIAQQVLNKADVIGAWLSGKIGQTVDFATQQAIDIAQQYVLFGAVYHTSIVVICAIVVAALCYFGFKKSNLQASDGESCLIPLIGGILPIVFIITNFKDMLLCWFAPKVWLIIQLTEMTKAVTK